MPMRISSSDGDGFSLSSRCARTIMPGVQKPHCRPCIMRKPSCNADNEPSALATPSMVVTSEPWACTANTVQLFTDMPSRSTVQAPQWVVAQEMHQQRARFDEAFDLGAVHLHGHVGLCHFCLPLTSASCGARQRPHHH